MSEGVQTLWCQVQKLPNQPYGQGCQHHTLTSRELPKHVHGPALFPLHVMQEQSAGADRVSKGRMRVQPLQYYFTQRLVLLSHLFISGRPSFHLLWIGVFPPLFPKYNVTALFPAAIVIRERIPCQPTTSFIGLK
jgi:hypothetical protein